MTTKRLVCLTVLAVAGVTACGGGAEEAAFDSPRAIADEIGCEYEGGSDELFVKEGGSCGDVAIYVFKDNANRDQYVEAASSLGGTYLVGDKWVVSAESADQLQGARDKIGGDIK
jgi:hypothetical protein